MNTLPELPYARWKDTNQHLHLMLQVVGKVRLSCQPRANHWWHVPFYVNARGLTTGPMPYSGGLFSVDFDFLDHVVLVYASSGFRGTASLRPGTIAGFYRDVRRLLAEIGVEYSILAKPFDESKVRCDIPFEEDEIERPYDAERVSDYFRALVWMEPVFQEFRGRYLGKSTPVHLFWHSMDLALTRFNGRLAPPMPQADPVTQDAYSHEVISFGFWAGDPNVPEPAFYSYTAPEPPGLADHSLTPDTAVWADNGGSHTAILRYEDVRTGEPPHETLLSFLESTYTAGASAAGWDIDAARYSAAYPAG